MDAESGKFTHPKLFSQKVSELMKVREVFKTLLAILLSYKEHSVVR